MSLFSKLRYSSQYGGMEEQLVHVNHIVRIAKSADGSQVFTGEGFFFCDQRPAQILVMMEKVFDFTLSN